MYVCVHKGREILDRVYSHGAPGRRNSGLEVKLEEMKMSPGKDLLTFSVEEHGLDSEDYRNLPKGISRAYRVRSSRVGRVRK